MANKLATRTRNIFSKKRMISCLPNHYGKLVVMKDYQKFMLKNKLEMTEVKHHIKDLDNVVKMAFLELKQGVMNQGIRFEQGITKQAIKFNQKVKDQGGNLLIKLSVVVSAVIVGTISLLDLMHKFQLI